MAAFAGHIRTLTEIPREWIERITLAMDEAVRLDPDFWNQADAAKPNRFEVFDGSTQHVVFKFPRNLDDHTAGSHVYDSWTSWSPLIEPIITRVNGFYGYANGTSARVMLAKLRAGAVIRKHIDARKSAQVPHKIHVPLITDPRVEFWEEDDVYFLEVGNAYEVNNRIPHGGRNESPVDRIHLIYDFFDSR